MTRRYTGVGAGERCPECGTWLKSSLALMSHRDSQPCKLEQTLKVMKERDWTESFSPVARTVLDSAGVTWERAPAVYTPGGMVEGFKSATGPRVKKRFQRPLVHDGTWAPAWAVTIVDIPGLDDDQRVRILQYMVDNDTRIREVLAVLALADVDALEPFTHTRAYEETCDDS